MTVSRRKGQCVLPGAVLHFGVQKRYEFVPPLRSLLVFFVPLQTVSAATVEAIKKRGSIVIGVKSDYRPWGFMDENGKLDGMEIELAQDLAKRLNVKLVLVPALSSNRVQLLNDGKVDLIMATFSVTEERKKLVAFVEPSYYAAMTAVVDKSQIWHRE